MEIQRYIDKLKNFQGLLIDFIDSSENAEEENKILANIFKDFNLLNNKEDMLEICGILSAIAKYHHRSSYFHDKIQNIILYLKKYLISNFTNFDIYFIFKDNKLILLILLTNQIIQIDEQIFNHIIKSRNGLDYQLFFYPEIKPFCDEKTLKSIENDLLKIDSNIFVDFNKKRKTGENDSTICNLIRNDSVKDFIIFVSQRNLSASTIINPSIFETHSFLLKYRYPKFIEYAAFFGASQIFKYLAISNGNLIPSLWLYAVHSNNPEIINLLKENYVTPKDETFCKCFKESIKCHHIEVAKYIEENLLKCDNQNAQEIAVKNCLHFYNYMNFPTIQISKYFYICCKYNHLKFVKFLSNESDVNINEKIVSNSILFYYNPLRIAANKKNIEIVDFLLTLPNIDIIPFALSDLSRLTHVKISSLLKEISEYEFSGCYSLKEVLFDVPSSVASIKSNAFFGCSSLVKIDIPSSVTNIDDSSFSECLSLKEVTFPPSLQSIGKKAFAKCSSLEQITIPSVISIGADAFIKCSSLKEVKICSALTSINDNAFFECSSLKVIKYPSSLASIGKNAFDGCSALEQIEIPSQVTKIECFTFAGCKSLKKIMILSNLTSIGRDAFSRCSSLEEIALSSSVSSIGHKAFNHCTSLKQITFPSSATCIDDYVFVKCLSLTEVRIPTSVKLIKKGSFAECSALKKIVIPSSVTMIEKDAFLDCISLDEITFENPSSLTTIKENAFFGCSSLLQISIPPSVKQIERGAFIDCSSLKEIKIPSVIDLKNIEIDSGVNILFI